VVSRNKIPYLYASPIHFTVIPLDHPMRLTRTRTSKATWKLR
jgi:hypothetical protein